MNCFSEQETEKRSEKKRKQLLVLEVKRRTRSLRRCSVLSLFSKDASRVPRIASSSFSSCSFSSNSLAWGPAGTTCPMASVCSPPSPLPLQPPIFPASSPSLASSSVLPLMRIARSQLAPLLCGLRETLLQDVC